ncbi:hypothetical protein D3C72_1924720 [compost metagenome]
MLVQVQRQALQHAQLRVARLASGDACHAVVVAVLPVGTGHIPHRGFGQFVEGGRIERGAGCIGSFSGGRFGVFDFQQRIGIQQSLDFLLQVQAVELQQPDRLQQLRGEVKLLTQLGRK